MVEFDTKHNIITVIVGVDGRPPTNDIQMDIQEAINSVVNKQMEFQIPRDSVTITVDENIGKKEKELLGRNTIYTMKIDVNLGKGDIGQKAVNAAHNTVVQKLSESGFNITGTATSWEGSVQL